jgi:membrane-associated phospholipid phosphatase
MRLAGNKPINPERLTLGSAQNQVEESMSPAWSLMSDAFRKMFQRRWVTWSCIAAMIAIIVIGPFDRQLSLWAKANSWDAFVAFQHHNIFEDGILGGSDFGVIMQIAAGIVFILGCLFPKLRGERECPQESRALRQRAHRICAYISLASLYSGLLLIQGFKFALGRARPYYVFGQDTDAYTEWFEFGVHSIFDGRYPGSFPSGHVASASAFFALLFIFPARTTKQKIWTALLFLACFVSWGAMTIARVMGRDHWPTDCLASGLLTLLSFAWFAALFGFQTDTHDNASNTATPVTAATYSAVIRAFVATFILVLSIWGIREILLAI